LFCYFRCKWDFLVFAEKSLSFSKKKKKKKKRIPSYSIKLNKALEPQATGTIRVTIILTHTMVPHPAEIAQKDGQLVRYRDNHFFYSVYTTLSQETRLKLASVKVAAYSKQKPSQLKGDLLRYGPYNDIAPLSVSNLTVHFENNSPFVVVKNLVKEYEVSQWGNLAVEETYEVAHEGAKITGPFNRYEFQRFGAPSSVNSIVRRIPKEASDIYYRDVIGNISTSHLSDFKENIRVDLIPRFPLFGGWKNAFYIGWNLPLSNYLSVSADDSNQYVLNVSFSAANNFLPIDDYTLRVILPEGARLAAFFLLFRRKFRFVFDDELKIFLARINDRNDFNFLF